MKSSVYKAFLFLTLILRVFACFSQQQHPDCLTPTTIIVPFDNSLNQWQEETIYYTPDDKYTYWYKIIAAQTDTLYYQLESINEEDEYNIILFKYKGNSFCNDVVYKNTAPLSNSNKNKLMLQAGDVYYLGVLHLNGKGCGHYLKLAFASQIKEVKAIQNECIEDAIERYVYLPSKKISKLDSDSVTTEVEPITIQSKNNLTTVFRFLNAQTNKPLETKFLYGKINDEKLTEKLAPQGLFISEDTGLVLIEVNKLGYSSFKETYHLPNTNDTINIILVPIKEGEKLVMYSIYFYPNTYALKPESKPELLKLADFMKENPDLNFEIQGHTNGNNRISKNKKYEHLGEAWNFSGSAKKLSKMRAESIKKFLVEKGVNPNNLITEGYGGDKMIIKNPRTMEQAMKNIRVEVHVIPKNHEK
jgi:outer membrane protein OmpA-like peptidoglycan-associated protein